MQPLSTSLHACRPHPLAPNKPPFNQAANVASKPLDAARDAVRNALHHREE